MDGPDLFAVLSVRDHAAARPHYERLLGEPAFEPHGTETVWELAPHRFVAVNEEPAAAGGGRVTAFCADLGATLARVAERGLEPTRVETYGNGVRKAVYADADGNELGFAGGAPA